MSAAYDFQDNVALVRSYAVAHMQKGEVTPLSGVLQETHFSAQIVMDSETEFDVPSSKETVLIQLLDRRPTLWSRFDGKTSCHDMRAGSLVMHPAGMDSWWHSLRCGGRTLHVSFDSASFSSWAQEEPDLSELPPEINWHSEEIDGLMRLLRTELESETRNSTLYRQSLCLMMAVNLARRSNKRAAPPVAKGGLAPRQCKRVTEYMSDHLADDVTITELASIANLSPFHFCRAFRQSTGMTPHSWLMVHRMRRAQELMIAHPEMGLMEVGLSVGYANQTSFGVAFKRVTNLTPNQWRQERMR